MKKIFILCTIFLLSFQVFAQKKYARIMRDADHPIEGNTAKMIKLFEGEIYEIIADESIAKLKSSKKGIIVKFGETTIEIPWGSGSKQTYDYPVAVDTKTFETYVQKQYDFVQKQDSIFKIDFSAINLNPNESIFIASQEVKDVVKIQSVKTTQITQAYFDKHFTDRYLRVLLPKMPTIVFSPQDFSSSLPNEDTQGLQTIENEVPTNYGWRNFLILMGVAVVALLIIFRKKILPQKEEAENRIKKENIRRNNEAKEAEPQSVIFNGGRDTDQAPREVRVNKEPEKVQEKIVEPTIEDEPTEIPTDLPEKWQIEFQELKLTNNELLKSSFVLEKELEAAQAKIKNLENQKPEFVILPNYEIFVKNNLPIFEMLHKSELQVQEFYEKSIHQKANAEKNALEKILFRYFFQKNKLKYLEKWQNIFAMLQMNGKIIDKDLLNLLSTDLTEKELHFILQTDLFEQIYKNWLSLVLIMFEEIQNLDKFTNSKFLMTAEMQEIFGKSSTLLIENIKNLLGKEINYVPLLGEFGQYEQVNCKNVAFSQLPLSSLYENINITKGQIWAIKSYGFNSTPSEIVVF